MTTFTNVSYDQFKQVTAEFFRDAKTNEEIIHGAKCVVLHYFGHDESWTDYQIMEAVILLEMVGRKEIEALLH
jgi:hypothetical protein